MKKILSILLIIIALFLAGCVEDDGPKHEEGDPFVDLIESLNDEVGSKTVFDLKLSGGVEKEFGYTVERLETGYDLTVKDGNSESYQTEELSEAVLDYENQCEGSEPKFEGNLKGIVFFSASELFDFEGAVRTVKVEDFEDGTLTYTPEIYEGMVKKAFICFKNIFLVTEDVLNMSFVLEEAGTKATITVILTAKYTETKTPVQVKLTVVHTKTVKIID